MMMLRLKWVGLLSLFFVLPIAIIRAHPFDGTELQHFFVRSPDCLAPCFMGIHPGITTVDDAITILQEHPWVSEIIVSDEFSRLIVIWAASDQPYIDTDSLGRFRYNKNVIQDINVRTHITLGEVWTTFGDVDWAQRNTVGVNRPPGTAYWVWYDQALPIFVFFVPEGRGMSRFDDLIYAELSLAYGSSANTRLMPAPSIQQLWAGLRSLRRPGQ